ncbi:N-acetylmuramoyl-L-alanine amidase [Lysinibacillus sp. LZ02]|uniref:N-acetylmuramoyl-L-alanine amidase n=1 Tax=Lysinibacillus sp. LZ02 TaxID=3420668 RepID=UPI003D364031
MIKVGYDAGHGFHTPGKRTPDGEREWSFNDIVARAFANELATYGNVASKRFDDSTGKTDVPLKTRTDSANAWGAHYYISFHHNANTAKWGTWTGVETFVYLGNSNTKSGQLAKAVHPVLVKAYGLKDRGIKEGNLHIVRETKMPAILIEGGFMDSIIDIKKLRDKTVLENAGQMIAQAFANFVGLKKVSATPNEKNKEEGIEMLLKLDSTTKGDFAKLFRKAYTEGIFTTDHSMKIANYSDEKIYNLYVSYQIRKELANK